MKNFGMNYNGFIRYKRLVRGRAQKHRRHVTCGECFCSGIKYYYVQFNKKVYYFKNKKKAFTYYDRLNEQLFYSTNLNFYYNMHRDK